MPLPENYYELISRANNEQKTVNRNIFPTGIAEDTRDPGSAYDFLGSALWGAISGHTWGVSEIAAPYGESRE